jgi:hypothetical protein
LKNDLAQGLVKGASQATEIGQSIVALLDKGRPAQAHELLAPVLAQRTPFRLLDRIGQAVGAAQGPHVEEFLERVAAERAQGSWPVIGSALGQRLGEDPGDALARCRRYIVTADVWYAADTLGERVPGPGLVACLGQTLALMGPWREDENQWVRRATGVAVHFWAKRSRGASERIPEAKALLAFLEPLLEEKEIAAAKGIGWGLKSLGRHYPAQVTAWLREQLAGQGRQPRAVVLRKARTYLGEDAPGRRLGRRPHLSRRVSPGNLT